MTARSPEDVDRLFGEYVNAGRLDDLVALYEPEGSLVQPTGTATGHAALREALGALLAAKATIRMHVVKVSRGGGDVALLYNEWSATATGPDGAPVSMSGKAREIVRRQPDGSWRFVIDDPYGGGA
jgi:ketosteroid isomerase-like protein